MTFREWMCWQSHQSLNERSFLSAKMIRSVLLHFVGLDASALCDYTFERHKTDHRHAKADLDIYDGDGKLIFQGREFQSSIAGYWTQTRVSRIQVWTPIPKALDGPATGGVLAA
jgi:hypothetical protein